MRVFRLTLVALATVLLLLLATVAVAAAAPPPTAQTYRVLVGAEQPGRGVGVMAYFPSHITIHVGDTVHWIQNSNEIHTVTFLGGQQLPDLILPADSPSLNLPTTPSPLVFNPQVVARSTEPVSLSDTTTWANSGIMGREQGQNTSFAVTFTAEGTYQYVCVVHGMMMSGEVTVVAPTRHVLSPNRYMALANQQIARQFAMAPAVFRDAAKAVQPATKNPDGTWTHHILLGYGEGQISLMRFFPTQVRVRPGDTVQWSMTKHSDAPHTVTFLNGQPEPPLADVVPQQSGSPVLYVDPGTLFPSGTSPLTRTGLFSSGLMNPIPGTGWSMVIGNITSGPLRYLCLLHDTSGMRGRLVVLPH